MRPPKSKVIELLKYFGLTMKRQTLKSGVRAWVVSDGKAFKSLSDVYSFYYEKTKEGQGNAVKSLVEKVMNENV